MTTKHVTIGTGPSAARLAFSDGGVEIRHGALLVRGNEPAADALSSAVDHAVQGDFEGARKIMRGLEEYGLPCMGLAELTVSGADIMVCVQ